MFNCSHFKKKIPISHSIISVFYGCICGHLRVDYYWLRFQSLSGYSDTVSRGLERITLSLFLSFLFGHNTCPRRCRTSRTSPLFSLVPSRVAARKSRLSLSCVVFDDQNVCRKWIKRWRYDNIKYCCSDVSSSVDAIKGVIEGNCRSILNDSRDYEDVTCLL